MSKIIINLKLNQNNKKIFNEKLNAIEINNTIKYKQENIINILNKNTKTLKRKTEEYEFILDYEHEVIKYILNNRELEIKIKIIKQEVEKNRINIKYEILDTKEIFEYKLEVLNETRTK